MQKVEVNLPSQNGINYPIYIGINIDNTIVNELNAINSQKIVVVTNETIWRIYQNNLENLFRQIAKEVKYCILKDGEQYKNNNSLEKILKVAFENKLSRNDAFIAFGGGVVGDMTGFAAAIYLRGIRFVQIPTTILAQVDSSVGGKVAINNNYGKNLLGAFYQPKAVYSDLKYLKTLPQREVLTGLSEVVKYAFIEKTCGIKYTNFTKYLFENSKKILNLDEIELSQTIKTCCDLKRAVVVADEKEQGLRAVLNFGHTIGHAIEKTTKYNVFTHGEAVSIGMKGAFLLAMKMNKISIEYFDFAIRLLESYGFDFKIPQNVTTEEMLSALNYDKKVQNGRIRFVLPVNYGEVTIEDNVEKNLIEEVLQELY